MDVWWDQLIVHIFRCQEFLEGLGCFVIKALEFWMEASGTKLGMRNLVSLEDGVSVPVGEWDSQDTIAVIIIDYEYVIISGTGGSDKFSSEIHVCLPSWCNHSGITKVCTVAMFECWWERISIQWWGRR